MALHVLFMRNGDGGPDEVRYQDRALKIGQRVKVGGRDWVVTAADYAPHSLPIYGGVEITARYICKRADR